MYDAQTKILNDKLERANRKRKELKKRNKANNKKKRRKRSPNKLESLSQKQSNKSLTPKPARKISPKLRKPFKKEIK